MELQIFIIHRQSLADPVTLTYRTVPVLQWWCILYQVHLSSICTSVECRQWSTLLRIRWCSELHVCLSLCTIISFCRVWSCQSLACVLTLDVPRTSVHLHAAMHGLWRHSAVSPVLPQCHRTVSGRDWNMHQSFKDLYAYVTFCTAHTLVYMFVQESPKNPRHTRWAWLSDYVPESQLHGVLRWLWWIPPSFVSSRQERVQP